MTIWNVSVPVVANIEADDGRAAIRKLTQALTHAGFVPYEPERSAEVFEAEQDPEAVSGLPEGQDVRKLLRLIGLITRYAENKFGEDEWWLGNAAPYIGTALSDELDELLHFADEMRAYALRHGYGT